MNKPIFTGAGVAIVTPFNESGIDYAKLEELIEIQIAGGIDSIVICGTTGESATMTDEEHVEAIRFTAKVVNKRVPVIAGAGSNDTKYAVNLTKECNDLGVDAILSVTPYYNKCTQEGLIAHFTAIAEATDLPIILYNVPGRTSVNIAPATVIELSKIDNIVAIKECNFSQLAEYIDKVKPNFTVYTGDDGLILPYLAMGAKGVISVLANLVPGDVHDICESFFSGNIDECRRKQLRANELINSLFCEVSPIPIKQALNEIGLNVGKCRLPLTDMTPAGVERLTKAMKDYGIL